MRQLVLAVLATASWMLAAPPRLIVRVDDMGYAHAGNEAIRQTYSGGIATSVEVIVPSPWFPEAVEMLQQTSVDVGVHLALTSEWDNVKWRPITESASLRDPDGYFFPMIRPNKNYPGRALAENPWKMADLERELRAQIELALKKIPRISHVSGHMGCTGLTPEVRELTAKLCREYKLRAEFGALARATYVGPRATSAEKIESFLKMLAGLEDGKTYVFVDHPGLDNAETRAIHHIGYENVAVDRQGVTDTLTHSRVRGTIQKRGIQLVGYRDLP